jgi:transposase
MENSVKNGHSFYSLAHVDVNTGMCIGYAVSMKSEKKDAYIKPNRGEG